MWAMKQRGWYNLLKLLEKNIREEMFYKLNKMERKQYWTERAVREFGWCKSIKMDPVLVLWDFETIDRRTYAISLCDHWFEKVEED